MLQIRIADAADTGATLFECMEWLVTWRVSATKVTQGQKSGCNAKATHGELMS